MGFTIQMGPTGLIVIPVIDGKQISPEEFETLPEATQNAILGEKRDAECRLEKWFPASPGP